MIFIYKNLIINYINKNLTVADIINFAKKNNTNISNSESIIIYNFIKRNYQNILNGDKSSFNTLKKEIDPSLYNKIIQLYMKYKSKLLL